MESPRGSDRTEDFVRLCTEHQRHVYLSILAQLPNRSDADDVMQETNLVLWRKFSEFQPGTNFRAWACRVAHFEVLAFMQKRRGILSFDEQVAQSIAVTIVERADELDARRDALTVCLQKLRMHDREIIRMRYADNASTKAVAQHVGRSIDAIYKALGRIHRTLMTCIERSLARQEQA
jgi:RNA polymerase sigma-70 factor, ECF subfamily